MQKGRIVPIHVVCLFCRKRFNAADALEGKRVKCPHCGNPVLALPRADGVVAVNDLSPANHAGYGTPAGKMGLLGWSSAVVAATALLAAWIGWSRYGAMRDAVDKLEIELAATRVEAERMRLDAEAARRRAAEQRVAMRSAVNQLSAEVAKWEEEK